MTRKQRRLVLIGSIFAVVAAVTGLVLYSLSDNIVFFNSPSEIAQNHVQPGTHIRLGGLVEEGSVVRGPGDRISFRVTDGKDSIPVVYSGVVPDLFREKQGVVTEGRLGADGIFKADTIFAKHDERYMPREVADALKKSGHWQEGEGTPAPAPVQPNTPAATGPGS